MCELILDRLLDDIQELVFDRLLEDGWELVFDLPLDDILRGLLCSVRARREERPREDGKNESDEEPSPNETMKP